MKQVVATITQRGQVTVPAEVRRVLGLKPRDKVAFEIDDGQVRLKPARFTVETAYGSVKPRSQPEDFKMLAQVAREEHVERVIQEQQQG